MTLKVNKHTTGVAVYDGNNLVLLSKGYNFLLPQRKIKIQGHERIPVKEVLKLALTKGYDRVYDIEIIGAKYRFTYTLTDVGIRGNSVMAEEYYFSTV